MTSEVASDSSQILLFTIGFTEKSAEEFFEKLKQAGVRRVVDIRLNNTSQLAGFAKKRDLQYFLRVIANIDYLHQPELAPTKEILADFLKKRIDWAEYQSRYLNLLDERQAATLFSEEDFDRSCLLCSEALPDQCHRRLAAEYLQALGKNVFIRHL
ncbi:MAG: DUF488 domain-containing protein [Thermoguttaceae bacterium]